MHLSRRGRRRHRRLGLTALVTAALVTLAACTGQAASDPSSGGAAPADREASSGGAPDEAVVALAPTTDDEDVIPGEPLTVTVDSGTLETVAVATEGGQALEGEVSSDGTSWTSEHPTEYGTSYTLQAEIAAAAGGEATAYDSTFTTLSRDDTFIGTYLPDQGTTVGVAMPVSIVFDKPIHDKAAVERQLEVTSTPAVEGAWSWMTDRDGKDRIDFRPRAYWEPGTEVTLRMDLVGVDAGGGLIGTQNRVVDFTIGDAVVSTVDVDAMTMTVERNGELLRTLPVSTGKEGFETWNGTMVVLSKVPSIRMNSATVGIFGPEAYDLGNVKWDVQLTPSGTYAHAAPWNEGKFGVVNASHGCIGMSTADARWFYDQVKLGDPVTVINSTDTVAVNNGYGAWNVDWETWQEGSALA